METPWSVTKSLTQTPEMAYESGKGVSGEVMIQQQPWRNVIVGSLRYLWSSDVAGLPDEPRHQDPGVIVVYVGIDGVYAGSLLITDAIRYDARSTIGRLTSMRYDYKLV